MENWRVRYLTAMGDWIAEHTPTNEAIDLVGLWVVSLQIAGPPDGSEHATGDLYVYTIREAAVRVEFLAVEQDRQVFVKRFLPIDAAL